MTARAHQRRNDGEAEPAGLELLVRALRHRNYRLFFGGQSVSLIGTWMQRVAVGWLAYRLTGSALTLGEVGFAAQIPMFLFAPFAGVLIDRWNLHRTLMVTQILSLAQAAVLAALVLTDAIEVWHLIALSAVLGVINMVLVKATKESALTQPSGISYAIPAEHLRALLAKPR